MGCMGVIIKVKAGKYLNQSVGFHVFLSDWSKCFPYISFTVYTVQAGYYSSKNNSCITLASMCIWL